MCVISCLVGSNNSWELKWCDPMHALVLLLLAGFVALLGVYCGVQGEATFSVSRREDMRGEEEEEEAEKEEDEVMEISKRARTQLPKLRLPPLLVFAHGAGAPSTSPWMQRWKKLLAAATNAVEVVTFDYPYCAGGKKGAPPKAERLIGPHLEEIKKAQAKHPGHPLILVGKSMGSRVSCMVATQEGVQVSAIVCLGYPLKGTKGALRDDTLLNLCVPVMFVQGSKDSLCPLDKLKGVLGKLTCATKLHIIEGGDHSFKVGKRALEENGKSQEKLEEQAVESIQKFLMEVSDVLYDKSCAVELGS